MIHGSYVLLKILERLHRQERQDQKREEVLLRLSEQIERTKKIVEALYGENYDTDLQGGSVREDTTGENNPTWLGVGQGFNLNRQPRG